MSTYEQRLGFSTMVYQDPGCPMDRMPLSQTVSTDASVDTAIETDRKKPGSFIPWWIVAVVGYLYYKEQQGV